ncbi:MAG: 4a-hydroxytetrahydrobiopterin dehydratase [Nitrososphaerales archaeon]
MTDEDWRKFSEAEIREGIKALKTWKVEKGKLHREFEFQSFEDAISYMVRVSLEISKMDHHPEWFNVYNTVKIDLVTHELDGISGYDFILAKKLETLAKKFKAK